MKSIDWENSSEVYEFSSIFKPLLNESRYISIISVYKVWYLIY